MKNSSSFSVQSSNEKTSNGPQLVTSITERRSDINYLEYVNNFEEEHCNFEYESVSEGKLQKSLTVMRQLVKDFNELLKKMLHKNYEFLAEFTREPPPIDTEKEIEILKAEIENSNKVIAVQESEKVKVAGYCKEIQEKEDYELELIKKIYDVKEKMPEVQLISKHEIGDIQRNGFVLVNQEEDQTIYIRLAILRADYERGGDRLRRLMQKNEELDKKILMMEERQYEANGRLDQLKETAKQKSLDVSTNTGLQALKEKYESLKKKREQEQKKIALFEHVTHTNETNIKKKISDMKKLGAQYENKTEILQMKVAKLEQENQFDLKNAKAMKKVPQSLPFRYAEVLLKGDKQKHVGNEKSLLGRSNDKNYELKEENGIFGKPKMALKYKSSGKDEKNVINFEDEDDKKPNKSIIFAAKKRNVGSKEEKRKINASMNDELMFHDDKKDDKIPQYRISKPSMNLKKKKPLKGEGVEDTKIVENEEAKGSPKVLPRLSQKKNGKKITDDQMRNLEEKGRKILGI